MSRPEDIPQNVWDKAEGLAEAVQEHAIEGKTEIARAILAAKAEERNALLALLAEAEDWDLGGFKAKGRDYLIQSVQSRLTIRLDEAIRKRGEA